ncbi:Hypp4834 [Branchiostoma lanceolatum]|uniref:Hypp4830 protein n=1 Tax=Branchiostoma lanceolatum TaxID=7740 RepID=A0A8K0F016_BRALA|nr:Hypp4830 [Branchiostoma lanceolatum]CAH1272378.1 Hypp4834 [Branchiostoma lanceolatum]
MRVLLRIPTSNQRRRSSGGSDGGLSPEVRPRKMSLPSVNVQPEVFQKRRTSVHPLLTNGRVISAGDSDKALSPNAHIYLMLVVTLFVVGVSVVFTLLPKCIGTLFGMTV